MRHHTAPKLALLLLLCFVNPARSAEKTMLVPDAAELISISWLDPKTQEWHSTSSPSPGFSKRMTEILKEQMIVTKGDNVVKPFQGSKFSIRVVTLLTKEGCPISLVVSGSLIFDYLGHAHYSLNSTGGDVVNFGAKIDALLIEAGTIELPPQFPPAKPK